MKILGLCCGRKMGNSEILLKKALRGAEEMGAEVEIMRLMDLNIKPCTGCEGCTGRMAKGEPAECVIKDDDMPFLQEKFGQMDGLIIGAPVYFLAPPDYLKVLTDRMISREMNVTVEAARSGEKKRPVGLISVGGGNASWVPMGISLMKLLTFLDMDSSESETLRGTSISRWRKSPCRGNCLGPYWPLGRVKNDVIWEMSV